MITAAADAATFGIRLIQNDHPSPTLFSCKVVVEEGRYLDVRRLVIEDDNWKAARLDYRLGGEDHVLPLFHRDGVWVPYRRWTERAYRHTGNVMQNRDYFRSPADVEKHNAQRDGGDQPPDRSESE